MRTQSKLIQYFCNTCGKGILRYERRSVNAKKRYCSLACRHVGLTTSDSEKFARHLSAPDASGCMNWTGVIASTGYGRLRRAGFKHRQDAHRVAYELAFGAIPDGQCVCHKCDNRRCCNPEHFFLGTKGENTKDAHNKGRMPQLGEGSHWAKLRAPEVLAIRQHFKDGMACREIASRFGMSKGAIRHIVKRSVWKSI